jgi:dUTP pyrophosphatase
MDNMMAELKIFKLSDNVSLPEIATIGSACFDIRCHLDHVSTVKSYGKNNIESTSLVCMDNFVNTKYIQINPHTRILIPTGLIFDILPGYSVRLHPRSSLSLKYGLTLINATGIIDSDYVYETFIPLYNVSDCAVQIWSGERICQGELAYNSSVVLKETLKKPETKSDRVGGFGSKGTL